LIALFHRVHVLQADPVEKRLLALDILEELIRRISRAEAAIRKVRASNQALKSMLAQRGNTREVAWVLKQQRDTGIKQVERQKELISVLRTIGDAIAFIYADRYDLKQFAFHEKPGFITGKRGARLERGILRRAFALGATVVLNDLTHTLRHGDITVFLPDGSLRMIEAKSGRSGKRSRTERQVEAAQSILSYIATDERQVDDSVWRRVAVAELPSHHFEAATRLAQTLPRAGWIREEVEPGLHYLLIDSAQESDDFASMFDLPTPRGRMLVMSVNECKKEHLGYYPFPLCFRDPGVLCRFYDGEFVMFVIVDLDEVNKRIRSVRLKIELTDDDYWPWRILALSDDSTWGERRSFVSFHAVGRIAAEFQSLDWVMANVVAGPLHDEMMRVLSADSNGR
jgi:hypothetical protein